MTQLFKTLFVAASFLAVCLIKLYYPAYQDDNIIEESVEQVIKYQTGMEVDVTPLSPEK